MRIIVTILLLATACVSWRKKLETTYLYKSRYSYYRITLNEKHSNFEWTGGSCTWHGKAEGIYYYSEDTLFLIATAIYKPTRNGPLKKTDTSEQSYIKNIFNDRNTYLDNGECLQLVDSPKIGFEGSLLKKKNYI